MHSNVLIDYFNFQQVSAAGGGAKLTAHGSAADTQDSSNDVARFRSTGSVVVSWDMKHCDCKFDVNLVVLVEDKPTENHVGFVAKAGNFFGFF